MWNFHLYPIQEISFYTQYRKFPSKMYQIGNKLCILYKLYKSHSLQGLVYMLYYSIQQYVIKFVSDLRHDGGFLPVLRFLQPKKNWPPRYSWNIVVSGVKHHTPKPKPTCHSLMDDQFVTTTCELFVMIRWWQRYLYFTNQHKEVDFYR